MPLKSLQDLCKSKTALTFALVPALLLTRAGFAQEPAQNPPLPPQTAPQSPDANAPKPPDSGEESTTITLEDAMKKAKLSRPIVVMAVGADAEEAEKPDTESIEKLAAHYELSQQQFGWVLAIGPKTMTALETNLGEPRPYDDMPPNEAMTLLMSSLTVAQRGKLTGKDGLGLSDLTDEMQKHLFQTMMPIADANITKKTPPGENDKYIPLQNLESKMQGAKLRIKQEVRLSVHTPDDSETEVEPPLPSKENPWFALSDYMGYNQLDTLHGVKIRLEMPNAPKPGNLNFNDAALQIAVDPEGAETVGALIERIGKVVKLELYADRCYEKRKITLRLGRKTAPAADLLRSLAFCVAGTYRKVGPAYILTDDLAGAGARRQIISDYEEENAALRYPALRDAERAIKKNPAIYNTKLTQIDPFLAITDAEEKEGKKPEYGGSGTSNFSLPFDKLTPEQQKHIKRYVDAQEKYAKDNPDESNPLPDLTKEVSVVRQPVVELLLPGINGPIRTEFGASLSSLFEKLDDTPKFDIEAFKAKYMAQDGSKKWDILCKKFARRGWISHARSRDTVDLALRRLKEIGLNELWITVFEDGKSLIPNTPFPIVASLRDAPDLLAYAVEAARKQNVKVCPVIDLFAWGSDTPQALRDLTIRGEDSEQDGARRYRMRVPRAAGFGLPKPEPPKHTIWINPFDPTVQQNLRGLLRAIAAHPGLGDWVWNEAVPDGYVGTLYDFLNRSTVLGYNEAVRLACIRASHRDPIDKTQRGMHTSTHRADVSLTNYDGGVATFDFEEEMPGAPKVVHEKMLRNALFTLYTDSVAGLPAQSRPNVLLQRGNSRYLQEWYDRWNPAMKDAPSLAERSGFEGLVPDSEEGAAKPSPIPLPVFGCFHFTLPLHDRSSAVGSKDVPNVLGLEVPMLDTLNVRQWDSIAVEEKDYDFDF